MSDIDLTDAELLKVYSDGAYRGVARSSAFGAPEHVAGLRAVVAQVRAQIAADIIATRDRHVGSLPLGTTTAPADRWALTYDYAARIARGES